MASLHRFQIARAERGVKRSEKAAGRRRGNGGGYGGLLAGQHGPAASVELATSAGGALGLAARKAPAVVSASADRAPAGKFLAAILALGAIAAIVAAALAAYGR